jgi:hypothetical protein
MLDKGSLKVDDFPDRKLVGPGHGRGNFRDLVLEPGHSLVKLTVGGFTSGRSGH